ncbi:DUF4158 domain-containing protein [Streptosporangium amethystogenes]|uniref:DUF4158 domain-containing protein n=1 Tax=Streptosporangium amethystogenes TaxID=2002 RepID=UPI0037B2FC75
MDHGHLPAPPGVSLSVRRGGPHRPPHVRPVSGTARQKHRRPNRLGWAVQWGTVRMLGTFLEDPVDVPRVVAEYVLGLGAGVVDLSAVAPERSAP